MEEIHPQNNRLYATYLISKAAHFLNRARQKELAIYDISPRQASVLEVFYNLGNKTTLVELSKLTDRGVSNLSAQLTRMENDGLVKKTREIPKSPMVSFELTKKGFDTHKYTSKMRAEKKIMSTLSEEECQQLVTIMNKIIYRAEKYRVRSVLNGKVKLIV